MGGIMAEGRASRRMRLAAGVAVALLGCSEPAVDAGAPPTSSPSLVSASEDRVVVRGRVRYEDRPYFAAGLSTDVVLRPARGALIEVTGQGGRGGEATTDGDGRFACTIPRAAGDRVVVTARASVRWGDHRARVIERGKRGRVYLLQRSATVGSEPVELVATAASEAGGAFNIADTAFEAFAVYAPHVPFAAPPLTFRWEPGRPFPCGSCFDHDEISVGGHPADTDEYDDDILLHEIGHYFVAHYSRDDSPGGFHRDRRVDPRLAFGEGLAYFFTNLVRGSPVVIDTYERSTRVIDNEAVTHDGVALPNMRGTSDGTERGLVREELTAGVLWDALDPPSPDEPFDRVALGEARIFALLLALSSRRAPDQGATGLELSDLLGALVCFSHVPASDVEALAGALAFPWAHRACGR